MQKPPYIPTHSVWALAEESLNASFGWLYGYEATESEAVTVGVIRIQGVLMRGDGQRWAYNDALGIANRIREAADKHGYVILEINSPGGMLDGLSTIHQAIQYAKKKGKVYAYINEGICASGGYHIAAACHKIYASKAADKVGSIGIMTYYQNIEEALKKAGIKIDKIYAEQSDQKNETAREAEKGNYTPLQKDFLNPAAEEFISHVQQYRQITDGNAFRGKLYRADQALEIGMIDGIQSLEFTIETLLNMKTKDINEDNPQLNALQKIAKTLGFNVVPDENASEAATQEEQTTNTSAAIPPPAMVQITATYFETLTQQVKTLGAEKEQLEQQVNVLTAERDTWKEKAETYGSMDGATLTDVDSENEATHEDNQAERARNQERDSYTHNQYVRNLIQGSH